jgi:hypothetical protein
LLLRSAAEILIQQILEVFLAAAVRSRFAKLERDRLEILEVHLALLNVPAKACVVAAVAGGDEFRKLAFCQDLPRKLEG